MADETQRISGEAHVKEAINSTVIGIQYQSGPSASELAAEIRRAFAEPVSSASAKPSESPLFLAPPLPSFHISRTLLMESAVKRLLAPTEPGVLRIEGLHGTGGAGKSTVAKALCHLPDVRSNFQGILWAELGTNANPIAAITRWIQALGDPEFQPSSLIETSDRLRIRLRGRRMLLVLDNVWHADDVRPFLVTSESVVLLTTRRAGVMDDLGGRLLDVPAMSDDEATALLQRWLGRPIHSDERDAALLLAESVDHLPMALELAGALLSRRPNWDSVRQAFVRETERLLEQTVPISRQLAKVLGCIRISVRELRKDNHRAWQRFASLAVVAGGTPLTPSIGATFWKTIPSDAALTLQELQDEALLQESGEACYFHDLVQDVALSTLTEDAPEGLGVPEQSAHRAFLANCGWSRTTGARSLFRDDGYTFTNLTWHLEMAQESNAIHELLSANTDNGKCVWWELLSTRGETATFLSDMDRASRLALQEPNPFSLLYRYSAMRSSLATFAQCLAPCVLRSLVKRGLWDIQGALAIAGQVQSPDMAAEMLTDIAEISSTMTEMSVRDTLLNLAAGALPHLEPSTRKSHLAARLCRLAAGQSRQRLYALTIETVLALPRFHGLTGYIPGIIQLLPAELCREGIRETLDRMGSGRVSWNIAQELARHVRRIDAAERHLWVEALRKWCEDWLAADRSKAQDSRHESFSGTSPWPHAANVGSTDSPANPTAYRPATSVPVRYDPEFARSTGPQSSETSDPGRLNTGGPMTPHAPVDDLAPSDIEYILLILVESGFLDPRSIARSVTSSEFRAKLGRRPDTDYAGQLRKIAQFNTSAERIFSLAALKDRLPNSLKKEAGEIAAEAIKSIWSENKYYEDLDPLAVLASMADIVPTEARPGILEELKRAAFRHTYDAGWHLAHIASALDTPCDVLKAAEIRFLEAGPGEPKAKAMAALIAVVHPHRVPYLLSEYQRIADDEDRARLRFSIAPHLGAEALLDDISQQGPTQRIRSLAIMMQELAPVLEPSQLRSFIEAATDLVADWWVIEALSDVLLRINNEQAILRVLSAARQIGPADLRSRLSSRVVHRLAECGKMDTAIASSVGIEVAAERWAGLADTAESLAGAGRFRDAALVATSIADREERGRAQASIVLHEARMGKWSQARLEAENIDSANWRSWVNVHLATAKAASDLKPGETFKPSERVFPAAVDEAETSLTTIETHLNSHPALRSLAAYVRTEGPGPDLSAFWKSPAGTQFFKTFAGILRPEFWRKMRHLIPLLARYSTKSDLIGLDRATRDAGTWWP